MQSTFCINCQHPLPAGAAFCSNCGARQTPAQPPANNAAPAAPPTGNNGPDQFTSLPTQAAISDAPTQLTPTPVPPSGDNTPTQLTPPPPPEGPLRADAAPAIDPYASQYQAAFPPPPSGPPAYSPYAGPGSGSNLSGPYANPQAPFAPPSPGYAAGPPPAVTPGGVAPWAQPQKGRGRRFAFGCIVAIVLVVLALGGGGVLAFNLLTAHKGGSNTGQHGSTPVTTGITPGTGSTPAATNTPNTSPAGQTLNNLNLQAIYAGVTITIMSAVQAASVPEYQPNDPSMDVLKVQARLDNSMDTHSVYVTENTNIVGPNGNPYTIATTSPANSLPLSVAAQANILGYWYFVVPNGTNLSDWKLVIGAANELQETIPLNGANYDPSIWQWVTKPITTRNTVTYYGGSLTGTVTKVSTGVWTPGYQAPQGMRFILVDLMVTNNSAVSAYVGDPEFSLLLPNGQRVNQKSSYGYFINDALGPHESKDEGYVCFLALPDKGDFQMIFFNQNNGVAAMIDLGTL
jgi:hypothetical protein